MFVLLCVLTKEKIMFHFYDGYHFFGMHMFWWLFWVLFISVLFNALEPLERKRKRRDQFAPNKSTRANSRAGLDMGSPMKFEEPPRGEEKR